VGKVDYAGGMPKNWYLSSGYGPFFSPATILNGLDWNGSVQTRGQGASLGAITNADGTSNTLLLAHKGMDPQNYGLINTGSGSQDRGWAWTSGTGNYQQHFRCAVGGFNPDKNGGWTTTCTGTSAITTSDQIHSSPHPNAMPCLFADGTGRAVAYSIDPTICSYLWFWNDGQTLPSSALGN
jgi:hypothetical protein